MIHYHGTPLGGSYDRMDKFCRGRNFLIPFPRPDDLSIVADLCQSFIFDNGAFSYWKKGTPVKDWSDYYSWVKEWCRHPRFNFAIIPDVIGGTEEENNELFVEWFKRAKIDLDEEKEFNGNWVEGAPVWHFSESLERLRYLMQHANVVCIANDDYERWIRGGENYHQRIEEAMSVLCDSSGRPRRKIHGLAMLSNSIVERYPFYSADSSYAAQSSRLDSRFGMYKPPSNWMRLQVLASRIEDTVSPSTYQKITEEQYSLF